MAQYFRFKILYTPLLPYIVHTVEEHDKYLGPIYTDFSQNHISYMKEHVFNELMVHDPIGVEEVKEFTGSNTVIK